MNNSETNESLPCIPIYRNGQVVPNAWFQRVDKGRYEFVQAEGAPDLEDCLITLHVYDDEPETHTKETKR